MKSHVMMVVLGAVAATASAQISPIVEDFNYGTDNISDVPYWYDTVATEAWAVFYNKSGDGNSPHDSATGGLGIQNGGGGNNHYFYRGMGTYAGEKSVAYSLNAGKWNGGSNDRSSELLVRVYRNNTFVPDNDVDPAADAGSLLVDEMIHTFTVSTNDPVTALSGTLDLSSSGLTEGDRLYFQIVDTNPNGHGYTIDDIEVVPQANYLLAMFEDFDYGVQNQKDIPYWYDSFSSAGWGVYFDEAGNTNSAHDPETGCVAFQGGAWAGTNQYFYGRIFGSYAGEPGLSYSLNLARWNDATIESVASDLKIRVFRNNNYSSGNDVDVADDPGSLLLDEDVISFAITTNEPLINLSGTLALPVETLSSGDVLYFEIVNTNPNGHYFNIDDLALTPSSYEIGDVSASITAGGGLVVSWWGTSNGVFVLQADDDLVESPGWTNIMTGISGEDGMMSVTTDTSRAQSFYRIVIE